MEIPMKEKKKKYTLGDTNGKTYDNEATYSLNDTNGVSDTEEKDPQ